MAQKRKTCEEKVISALSLLSDEVIIMSCSGGPDSMALLNILKNFYRDAASQKIIVAHIHHGLRESADRDEKIVQNYCLTYNLTFECLRAHVREESKKTHTSIEECARNIRKEWGEEIRKKHQAIYIITAHHADDQAETLLYRITKGTSITGLIGIEALSGYYLRPMLDVGKKEIMEYVEKNNIPYGFDETNDDILIPRNLLRNEVLPRLRNINPEVVTSLKRLSNSSKELKEGFDIFFADQVLQQTFDYDWYQSLPRGFQHELLRCLYESTHGSTHGFSGALVLELDRFLSTRTGGKKEFGKKWLIKKQGTICLV